MALRKEIENGANLEQEFTRAPITTSTPLSTSTSSMRPEDEEDYNYNGPSIGGGHPYPTGGMGPSNPFRGEMQSLTSNDVISHNL